MAHSALRPQDRLRGSGVSRPEAPQLLGLGSWSPLSSFLGKACLTLPWSQAKEGTPRGFLPPDGGGKPALPLWAPPGSEGSRACPPQRGTEGSGNRTEGWSEGSVPSHHPSLDRLPAPSPPTLPLSSGAFVSPGRGERRSVETG